MFAATKMREMVAITFLMRAAASTSETSINFYQKTWHNIPEGGQLHNNNLSP
jgi:hypothetical protein